MANVITIQTISELLDETPVSDQLYQVAGYYAANDGGGGLWRWDNTSDKPPNYGSVIGKWDKDAMPAGYPATGRFLLVHEGVVNVRQFGARGFGNDLDSQIGVTYPIKRFL